MTMTAKNYMLGYLSDDSTPETEVRKDVVAALT